MRAEIGRKRLTPYLKLQIVEVPDLSRGVDQTR